MKHLIITLFLILSIESRASLVRPGYEFARATGMGNAFIALADDATSIFYNPAGLAKNKSVRFHLVDTQLLVDNMDSLTRLKNAVFDGQTENALNPDKQSLGFSFKPTLITPYFGLSLYSHGFGLFELQSLQGENAEVFALNDLGAALAFGIPFSDYFSFGFGIKAIQRTSIELNKPVSELLAELGLDSLSVTSDPWTALKRYSTVGYGFPLSAGFLITLPQVTRSSPVIQFAATAENLGGTSFSKTGDANAPGRIDTSYHLGSLLQYPLNKKFVLNLTTDLRDQFRGLSFLKTFHTGAELRHKFFGVRAGLSEGYATYGFSLEFPPHTKLHFSSYAKETGENLWEKQKRFYQLQLIVGFNPL